MALVRILFSFSFLIYSFSQVCAQTHAVKPPVVKPASAQDAAISKIRKAYNQINALALKKEKFTYEVDDCVENGVVTYYTNGKAIVKITESGGIGDGSWKSEYYYQSGKVIFYFDSMLGGPTIGKATIIEGRIYIENDQPIRNMQNKEIIEADSRSFEIIQTAYKLLKAYKTKDFAAALCNP